jgi:hypothetical protein
MEASENAGLPREGRGGPDLQRIDRACVRRSLRDPASVSGYDRLAVMVETILPRLMGEGEGGPGA